MSVISDQDGASGFPITLTLEVMNKHMKHPHGLSRTHFQAILGDRLRRSLTPGLDKDRSMRPVLRVNFENMQIIH